MSLSKKISVLRRLTLVGRWRFDNPSNKGRNSSPGIATDNHSEPFLSKVLILQEEDVRRVGIYRVHLVFFLNWILSDCPSL